MGKKDRERQKRLQPKRAKKAAKRAARGGAGGGGGRTMPSLDEFATMSCVRACETMLSGAERPDGEIHGILGELAHSAGGVWPRLLPALEQFIFDESPWSLTCSELAPLRRAFERNDAEQAFGRLWALTLTNESDGTAFVAAPHEDFPQRAAAACHELRECLADQNRSPAAGRHALESEILRHGSPRELADAYTKLIAAAFASFKAPAAARPLRVADLARNCQRLFDVHGEEGSDTAWWHCGKAFFAEVFERHARAGYAAAITAYPQLIGQLFDAADAALWLAAHSGVGDSLRAVHTKSSADSWLRILEKRIDVHALPFEDRVRFEVSKLKLLFARQMSDFPDERSSDFLAAFDGLRKFLAHGVPPANRELPPLLEAPLLDFYLNAVQALDCEAPAFATTESLLRRHPDDFRLACLFATGALQHRQRHKLQVLRKHVPRAHIDADLFARSALSWEDMADDAAAAIRPVLFDPLDREHRKQCLLKMSQLVLSRATSLTHYRDALGDLLPYFELDNFVMTELSESSAIESALVFLATMMAPYHGRHLTLTEAQSRQWVSHAREIAQRSPLAAKLVAQLLRMRAPPFTLSPTVRSAAVTQIAAIRPANEPLPAAQRPSRRTKVHRPANHSGRRELFDDHNP